MGLPMLAITWEQIMGLIASVKYIENSLDGRKSNQGQGKSAQKNPRIITVDEKKDAADANHPSTGNDTRLGRKIDTTA